MKTCKIISTVRGGEAIHSGILHAPEYTPGTYRRTDGSATYCFRYVELPDGRFEIDLLSQPSYGHRAEDAHITHRLPSARGGRKICISAGHEPRTIELAKQISVEWADLTHEYIRTGRTIDAQVASRSLPPQDLRAAQARSFLQRLLEMFDLQRR